MSKTIVVTVTEFDGTPEEAEHTIRESESRYEGFHHVYAADSLNNLPHPMQISEISYHFLGE